MRARAASGRRGRRRRQLPEGEENRRVDPVAEHVEVGQPGVEGDLLAGVDVPGAVGAIAEQPGVAHPHVSSGRR